MIIPKINRNYPSAHSHPPPDDTVVEQIFRQNVLAKISKNPVGPLRKSYDEEVEIIPETVNFIRPSYNKIRPSLVNNFNFSRMSANIYFFCSQMSKKFWTVSHFWVFGPSE